MYRARFGDEHLAVMDIEELRPSDLPADLHLLTASFPCIDLSLAGNRRGLAGRQSGTIWPFLRLVADLCRMRQMPDAVLLENVTGLLTSHGGQDLAGICEHLASLGYALDMVMVDARWFVPQSRPRLFIVAFRSDPALDRFALNGEDARLRPPALRKFLKTHASLPLVSIQLPSPPPMSPTTLVSVLDDVPIDDSSWWPEERVQSLLGAMAPAHRQRVAALTAGERDGVATMFRRVRRGHTVGEVRPDRIAGCLRTPQGGSSVQFLVDGRSGLVRIRPLTGREYGRLQGVDDFPMPSDHRQARWGFGDAVCVPAVRWLVDHALGQRREAMARS